MCAISDAKVPEEPAFLSKNQDGCKEKKEHPFRREQMMGNLNLLNFRDHFTVPEVVRVRCSSMDETSSNIDGEVIDIGCTILIDTGVTRSI